MTSQEIAAERAFFLEPGLGFASSNGASPKLSFPRTDAGNGELLAYLNRDQLRFDHKRGRWLIWAGDWWQEDGTETVVQTAKAAARWRYLEAVDIEDLKERQKEAAWASGSESRGRIEAALVLARSEPPIADDGGGWDNDPYLMGVNNGVLDLRTGHLRRGSPGDKITKHAPVSLDSAATCPTFDAFLARVQPDPPMREFLQRRAGSVLTGDVSEQDLLFFHGGGSNGKTTYANALMDVLGRDYAKQAAPGLLLRKHNESHPTELADLDGARLVVSTEIDDGRDLAEGLVKQLTGGDRLKARRMRQDFYEFEATHKIILLANYKPVIKGTDWAIWKRIKLVPWDVTIAESEKDPHLRDKLQAEAPGILNWMIVGCLAWQQGGVEAPSGVQAATEAYRSESDPVALFLADSCVHDERYTVTAGAIFKAYQAWTSEQGIRERDRLSATAFGRLMGERYARFRSGTQRGYLGVGLLSEHQEGLPDDAFGVSVTRFESEDLKTPVRPKDERLAIGHIENTSNASQPVTPSCYVCSRPTDAGDLCANCETEVER